MTATDTARVAPAALPASNHRLDIQGLRALAVLMVVGFHADLPMPGGFVGVDVFLVISGFVITLMLMREWETHSRIRFLRFYVRRFKRLIPALALTVGTVMILATFLMSPIGGQQETLAKTGLGAMFLSANAVISETTGGYFDGPAESNALLNTWSLSVEEQFYLAFPAVLLVGFLISRKGKGKTSGPTLVVGVVAVVSLALALVGSSGIEVPFGAAIGFYSPISRAWEFAVGALLALLGHRLIYSKTISNVLAILGAALLIASLWLISGATPFPGVWTLIPVAGTAFLIIATANSQVLSAVLSTRPLVFIGDLSYSIYLWHWPLIVFAKMLYPDHGTVVAVTAAAISFVPAYVSYRWVEQPLRALPAERGLPLAKLAICVILPPTLLAGGLWAAASNGFWNPAVQAVQAATTAHHVGREAGCTFSAWEIAEKCTWNDSANGRPIYLVGDSNADHFSEGVIGAAKETGRPMQLLVEEGCAFLDVSLDLPLASHTERCQTFVTETTRYLGLAAPGTVIIANSYHWFLPATTADVGLPADQPAADMSTKLAALESSLTHFSKALPNSGHEVILVQQVPHWDETFRPLKWEGCGPFAKSFAHCAESMELSDVAANQGAVARVVSHASRHSHTSVLDLTPELCPTNRCQAMEPDGLIRYRDTTHLSVQQSASLVPVFTQVLERG